MPYESSLSATDVLEVFTEEVAGQGGRVTDAFNDGQRLFARSVLPDVREVRRGDKVQGGVAVKATEEGVWLYPYVFRLVCTNGAIIAETLGSRTVEDLSYQDAYSARQSVREGVEACCSPEVFADNVRRMRTADDVDVDITLSLLPLVSRFNPMAIAGLMSQVMDRFFRDADRSQFGLANAVTAVARDTRDPDLKWDLEVFGGGLAVGLAMPTPVAGRRTAVARSRRSVSVG